MARNSGDLTSLLENCHATGWPRSGQCQMSPFTAAPFRTSPKGNILSASRSPLFRGISPYLNQRCTGWRSVLRRTVVDFQQGSRSDRVYIAGKTWPPPTPDSSGRGPTIISTNHENYKCSGSTGAISKLHKAQSMPRFIRAGVRS
jgi:hypothetical protein